MTEAPRLSGPTSIIESISSHRHVLRKWGILGLWSSGFLHSLRRQSLTKTENTNQSHKKLERITY